MIRKSVLVKLEKKRTLTESDRKSICIIIIIIIITIIIIIIIIA